MAMYGVRFRNTHSRDVGLLAKTGKRPAAPPVRTVEETILYRDGNLDYSEQGGRLFYDDKLVEVEFTAIAKELSDTDRLIAAAVKWLSGGWGELIFDDMPLVKWLANRLIYRISAFRFTASGNLPYNSGAVRLTIFCLTVWGFLWIVPFP